ncbi:eukaryotic initiation factor 4A-15 [Cinnamomum micranthum f. kanehirae]|uniref:Eukaryotic initiation factor 4A-15 n=1 Tax=Cinnamomum micranthum f. kanehirae TaxID=337451 RepID=A0A443PDK9_9MAGN|nr:eukaryotic initiation factor 4A-15 [Cinnamomum micranthum f. kanehirae]
MSESKESMILLDAALDSSCWLISHSVRLFLDALMSDLSFPARDMAGLAPERSQYGARQGSQEKKRGAFLHMSEPSCHVIMHAPNGLRRTVVFCSGILSQLDSSLVECQALGVIFVNTRRKVVRLTDEMRSRGHTVSAIHSHMDKNARDIVLHEFHSGSSRVLITTDRYARRIDVPQFSVVNFDMPVGAENYIHRIRCGGRFSRKGVVISFVICEGGVDDPKRLGDIQVFTGTVAERMPSNMAKLI